MHQLRGQLRRPRRGADILSGFGSETRDLVRWLDGRETAFNSSTTPGDFCNHAGGGDCDLRATGETPLAGSLQAIEDYIVPIRATDCALACRTYSVILVTDGAESCNGDPVAAAQRLHDVDGVDVYVVAVSVLPSEQASLNQIAMAGSGGTRGATFVTSPDQLVPALSSIVAGSIRFERCNGVDDDCDGLVDEGFPGLAAACDDGGTGACRGTGTNVCSADGLSVTCDITSPGATPSTETCNGADDDCDGRIDEDLTCTGACTPTGPEVCNGVDDDCNGAVDEADPALGMACGSSTGTCMPGTTVCVRGMLTCAGAVGPRPEVCNGLDDDCNGMVDDMAPCPGADACIDGTCDRSCDPSIEFACPVGYACTAHPELGGSYCIATACAECTADQRCVNDHCVDACADVTCPAGQTCRRGVCQDCYAAGCPSGQLCIAGACAADPCAGVHCTGDQACSDGTCIPVCDDPACPSGQRCSASGACVADPCAGVSCDGGQRCDPATGHCGPDRCATLTCPLGRVCVTSSGCVDDPCRLTRCPNGRTCQVSASGVAVCAAPAGTIDAGAPRRYVSAEGGGGLCSAAPVGPRPAGFVPLLLTVALLFERRRRRETRASRRGRR